MLYMEMLVAREEQIGETRRRVERNRLEARLARSARSNGDGATRRSRIARGASLVTALFGIRRTA